MMKITHLLTKLLDIRQHPLSSCSIPDRNSFSINSLLVRMYHTMIIIHSEVQQRLLLKYVEFECVGRWEVMIYLAYSNCTTTEYNNSVFTITTTSIIWYNNLYIKTCTNSRTSNDSYRSWWSRSTRSWIKWTWTTYCRTWTSNNKRTRRYKCAWWHK